MRKSRSKTTPAADKSFIIPRAQHKLSKTDVSTNALKVLNRLNSAGYQAFLVGGSVRDLLLGKVPKDFDVATNATPNQIKNLFRNARIIGRRFKLVHIIFHRDIIEVATFRGSENMTVNQLTNEQGMLVRDNVYGTLEEDAWRRDFTINSLYYNINDASIIDLTGGFNDARNNILRIIGEPEKRYQEDPVRMLRAMRFCAKLNFSFDAETAKPLIDLSSLIKQVSSSRLFDEIVKLYQCGAAASVQQMLLQYGLFKELFQQTCTLLESSYPVSKFIQLALESTDERVKNNKPITPAFLFAVLLWFPLRKLAAELQQTENLQPLAALEQAMTQVVIEQNKVIAIPKRYSQVMREIWLLQFRFPKRFGSRAASLLQHPRFRAAYDFLVLRALAGEESMELADWWTTFQEVSENDQMEMTTALIKQSPKKPRTRRKPKPAAL